MLPELTSLLAPDPSPVLSLSSLTASLGTTDGQRIPGFSPEGRVQGGPREWEQLPQVRAMQLRGRASSGSSEWWGGALMGKDAEPAGVATAMVLVRR